MYTHSVILVKEVPVKCSKISTITFNTSCEDYLTSVHALISQDPEHHKSYAINPKTFAPLTFTYTHIWLSTINTKCRSDFCCATFSDLLEKTQKQEASLNHIEICNLKFIEQKRYAGKPGELFKLLSQPFQEQTKKFNFDEAVLNAINGLVSEI
ncbi:hypothetical protein FG062_14750 [Vibrio cholerae]|nr:hypothetical protein [Vibrio cholerae]EGR0600873.1 hypothetical protein [Vibrio cholerae]